MTTTATTIDLWDQAEQALALGEGRFPLPTRVGVPPARNLPEVVDRIESARFALAAASTALRHDDPDFARRMWELLAANLTSAHTALRAHLPRPTLSRPEQLMRDPLPALSDALPEPLPAPHLAPGSEQPPARDLHTPVHAVTTRIDDELGAFTIHRVATSLDWQGTRLYLAMLNTAALREYLTTLAAPARLSREAVLNRRSYRPRHPVNTDGPAIPPVQPQGDPVTIGAHDLLAIALTAGDAGAAELTAQERRTWAELHAVAPDLVAEVLTQHGQWHGTSQGYGYQKWRALEAHIASLRSQRA